MSLLHAHFSPISFPSCPVKHLKGMVSAFIMQTKLDTQERGEGLKFHFYAVSGVHTEFHFLKNGLLLLRKNVQIFEKRWSSHT